MIIGLCGPIGVGKSTLAKALTSRAGEFHLKSSSLVLQVAPNNHQQTRAELQASGDKLDATTHYRWLIDGAKSVYKADPTITRVVIDSCRHMRQVEELRKEYKKEFVLIALRCDVASLLERLQVRHPDKEDLAATLKAFEHPLEQNLGGIAAMADIVFDTVRFSSKELASCCATLI